MIANTLLKPALILTCFIFCVSPDTERARKKVEIFDRYHDGSYINTLSLSGSQLALSSGVLPNKTDSVNRTRLYWFFDIISHIDLGSGHLTMTASPTSYFALTNYSLQRRASLFTALYHTLNPQKTHYNSTNPTYRKLFISGATEGRIPLHNLTKIGNRQLSSFSPRPLLTPNKSQTLYCGLNNLYLSNIYNPTHTALRFTQAILASLWLDYSNSTRAPFPPLPSAFPFPGFNCELLLHLAVNAVDYVAKIHNALAPNDIYYNIQQSAGNDPSTTSLKETGGLVGRARDTQNFIIDHIRDGKSIIAYSIILLSLVSLIVYLSRLVRKLRTSERVLKERFSLARAMCDGTPNPTYIRDRQGLLLDCNKAYLDTLRLERHKAIQKNIITTTYFHESPEQAQALHNEYLTVMATGLPSTFDHVTQTSDGQEVTINYWIRPYKGIDNTILGIIAGWDDVSEYRRLLTELSEAKKIQMMRTWLNLDFWRQ